LSGASRFAASARYVRFGKPAKEERLMLARIYQPAKSAMQSGRARTRKWVLEYEPEQARDIEPLMGWTSSSDMRQQISLDFDTREEAVNYAKSRGIPYQLFEPHKPAPKVKSYSDNFRFDRKIPWSH
jgi:hypothetical protein